MRLIESEYDYKGVQCENHVDLDKFFRVVHLVVNEGHMLYGVEVDTLLDIFTGIGDDIKISVFGDGGYTDDEQLWHIHVKFDRSCDERLYNVVERQLLEDTQTKELTALKLGLPDIERVVILNKIQSQKDNQSNVGSKITLEDMDNYIKKLIDTISQGKYD